MNLSSRLERTFRRPSGAVASRSNPLAAAARKQTPPLGTSPHAHRLARMERLTQLLDEAIRIPGTRFHIGWDTIIGLIPGVGDVATACMSGYVIHQAWQMGVGKRTLARMAGNIAVDMLVGSIPLVGDFFDATFKANRRNMRLLKRRLAVEATR
ncbi:hypothetical protein Mal4_18180 [Maioricimonas rarisocia]|uniref:DUF4112 domain-containing protein n=1 Tax=Maioricimonas rarisocia TaxID=2528026 RepID=A0A517Z4X2_9PLAN|nr:DUF4112 domain-containing protein [Maioricimonas rarisocia]QDU37504.1 hypothetical protein Mal4_18180 [Maioricimonas rarisocia]